MTEQEIQAAIEKALAGYRVNLFAINAINS
jgi:hypothetical protein